MDPGNDIQNAMLTLTETLGVSDSIMEKPAQEVIFYYPRSFLLKEVNMFPVKLDENAALCWL